VKLRSGSPTTKGMIKDKTFDLMVSFKKSSQASRAENQGLLEQISFLKKCKKLTSLHEYEIEINELTAYSKRQA